MKSFSGSSQPSFEQWLGDFECNTEAVNGTRHRNSFTQTALEGWSKNFHT